MKIAYAVLLSISLGVLLCCSLEAESRGGPIHPDSISFTILYDNEPLNDSYVADNGFSCLVEIADSSYLFDAGRIAGNLGINTEKLGIDCSRINFVFFSHLHSDHIGGLPGIIGKCNKPALYLPFSFPKTQDERGRAFVVEKLENAMPLVSDTIHLKECVRLNEHCYSTGMFEDRTYEQALIINTSKGLIILVGCSHPGIDAIVRQAKSLMKRDVYCVMGGFHLVGTDSEQVKSIADELKSLTKYIAPCHCTGKKAQGIFKDVFKEDYIEIRAGLAFKVPGTKG